MKIHTPVRIAVLASLLAAAPAIAQDEALRSNTRGFTLGAHLNGSAIQLSGGDAENGGGLGIAAGFGVSNKVTVFGRVGGADVKYEGDEGSYTLANIDLGGRYSFGGSAAALRPYLELALGGVGVSDEVEGSDVTLAGGAFNFGGGLEYFFNKALALDVGLVIGAGEFTKAQVDGEEIDLEDIDMEESFTTSRLNVGLSWHP
jgi:hypothetical protein